MLPFQAVAACDCQELPYFRGGVPWEKLFLLLEHKKLKLRTMARTAWKDYYRTNLSFPVCCLCSKQEYIYLNCFSENCTVSSRSEEVSFKFWQSDIFFPGRGKGVSSFKSYMEPLYLHRFCPKPCFWVYYHSDTELKTILASNSTPKVCFLLWLYFATISLFLRNISTWDGLVALCTPD